MTMLVLGRCMWFRGNSKGGPVGPAMASPEGWLQAIAGLVEDGAPHQTVGVAALADLAAAMAADPRATRAQAAARLADIMVARRAPTANQPTPGARDAAGVPI